MTDVVRVGLLGCGNVGAALVRLLDANADLITQRSGVRLEVGRVAVHNVAKERDVELADGVLTNDADAVVSDPNIDVVVEVIGGVEPARRLILTALKSGKPVVTANKELLANFGEELFDAAETAGVDLLFEASVAGGIPLMRPLRESLAGERITPRDGHRQRHDELRAHADDRGRFELLRSGGRSAGARLRGTRPDRRCRGPRRGGQGRDHRERSRSARGSSRATCTARASRKITADDIARGQELGYVVKLLAVAEENDGGVGVRVHPAMVPVAHPLASVRGSYNAVFIEGEAVGQLMLLGRGAGGGPTASAVLGDLIDAAKNVQPGARGATIGDLERKPIRPIDETASQFYVSLDVADQPGVLATIAGVFGDHEVSIQSMQQKGQGDGARLIFVTHLAREAALTATIHAVRELDVVLRIGSVLRVVGGEE